MTGEQTAPYGKTHSATVIIFHGSGDTGPNIKNWIRFLLGIDLAFPHIKILYPTAPFQPYTPLNGAKSHVWFDRKAISNEVQECRKSLSAIYQTVNEYLNVEIVNGIPIERIIVGGFSMGGALALHTGYHINRNVAGVFACSSFLNHKSIVYESVMEKTNDRKLPELLMFHGDSDGIVDQSWGNTTFDELQSKGVSGKFTTLANADHELTVKELQEIKSWILEKLPLLDSDIMNRL